MTYSPILVVHILGGMVGVASGSTALVVRKGGPTHRRAGAVFVIAMLFMGAAGAIAAIVKAQGTNVMAGVFTCYLVATAALTVRRRPSTTGRAEVALLCFGLAIGLSGLALGWAASRQLLPLGRGDSAAGYVVFGILTLLFVSGDVRMLVRGGVAGSQRLVRHLWRMSFALFIAAGSFFLGTASDPVLRKSGLRATLFTPAIRKTGLPAVPVLIIVALTVYWLWRVQSGRNARKATA